MITSQKNPRRSIEIKQISESKVTAMNKNWDFVYLNKSLKLSVNIFSFKQKIRLRGLISFKQTGLGD